MFSVVPEDFSTDELFDGCGWSHRSRSVHRSGYIDLRSILLLSDGRPTYYMKYIIRTTMYA